MRILAGHVWNNGEHQWLRADLSGQCNACFPKIRFLFYSLPAEFHGLWDSLVYDVEVKSHVSCYVIFQEGQLFEVGSILSSSPASWSRLTQVGIGNSRPLAAHVLPSWSPGGGRGGWPM